MNAAPWEADRPLTQDLARAIVGAQFSQVDFESLSHLGSGWEFDAFRTADGWIFRFPRRADSAGRFESEARVHDVVARVLPSHIAIPRVELLGEPGSGFPYRFAGHRFMPGEAADTVESRLLPTIAGEIGRLLGAIHSIGEETERAAGVGEPAMDDAGGNAWVDRCLGVLPELRGLDPVVDTALKWITQQSPLIRRFDGPLRFIRQDLSPGHLIVDGATGRLNGVLDWTGAIPGDAARDFVFIVTWRGWGFAADVLDRYPLAVDARFRDRLLRSARVLSVLWLAEANERGMDLVRPVQALRNAFHTETSLQDKEAVTLYRLPRLISSTA